MKKLLNEWRKHLKEAQLVPGETTAAQLRDDPALSGYRSGERKTVDIPADYGKEERAEEKSERSHDTVRVLEAYWDDEEEEIRAYYDKVKEEFEKPGGILDQIERMSGDERRVALDDLQQKQEDTIEENKQ